MLTALFILIASCLVSFVGSLQLGPVNLFVINTVLYNNKRAAFWVALGGSLPEFIYCALAVYASSFLQQSVLFQLVFKIIFIGLLVVVGFTFLLKKIKPLNTSDMPFIYTKDNPVKYVLKGFSLAILNPQLLPFWMFVLVYFNSVKLLQVKSEVHHFSYILGSGLGAFMLLSFLILVIHKYKITILKHINNKYYFKALAVLFFLIAIQQLISLLNKS